jgi:hypothetical protein
MRPRKKKKNGEKVNTGYGSTLSAAVGEREKRNSKQTNVKIIMMLRKEKNCC